MAAFGTALTDLFLTTATTYVGYLIRGAIYFVTGAGITVGFGIAARRAGRMLDE